MTVIRPTHLSPTLSQGSARPPAQPAANSFLQRLQGAQAQGTGSTSQASQTPGHSLDDGSRPLTPTELQDELRSVALQQGMMMGQRLLSMANGGPKLDTE